MDLALHAWNDMFFNEWFWLPKNMTWNDFENRPDDHIYIAQPRDLMYMLPTAIIVVFMRLIFERLIAYPVGRQLGVQDKIVKAPPNVDLERLYKQCSYPRDKQVEAASKQLDLSERIIQRWFRRRRNQDRPTVMTKFTETAWRMFFYASIFIYGVIALWDKPWFLNTKECWTSFPRQHVDAEIFWYYMMELGFYLGLLFSQFLDIKRKDFLQMFIHHIATILLMCFSWMCNVVRIGSLVLVLHDSVDYFLEGAKLAKYCNNAKLCDFMFGMFTIIWFITRLVIYPLFILYSTAVEAEAHVGYAHSIALFNLLLMILQVLHVIWFYIIASAAYTALRLGKIEKDIRSASEESSDDDSQYESPSNASHSNGHS